MQREFTTQLRKQACQRLRFLFPVVIIINLLMLLAAAFANQKFDVHNLIQIGIILGPPSLLAFFLSHNLTKCPWLVETVGPLFQLLCAAPLLLINFTDLIGPNSETSRQ